MLLQPKPHPQSSDYLLAVMSHLAAPHAVLTNSDGLPPCEDFPLKNMKCITQKYYVDNDAGTTLGPQRKEKCVATP